MAEIVYTEAVSTQLSLPILTVGATSMSVVSVAQMPTLTSGDWFYLTLYNNDVGTHESVKVTDITGIILTIERGQDSTIAQTFTVSQTTISAWIIGAHWEDLRTQAEETFATPSDLATAVAPFLEQAAIQTLINDSLDDYITTADATALVTDFQDETEINDLIATALLGYTTSQNVLDTIGSVLDLTDGITYKWTVSPATAGEYFLELFAGGDPSLAQPSYVLINQIPSTEGAVGSLGNDEWDYGDNDSLGYSTIYVKLTGGTDPDLESSNYILYDGGGLISDQVNARQLQSGSQVDVLISTALASGGFLSSVSITNSGETIGILSGLGTSASPLTVNWGGANPALITNIPANNTHRASTDNPHEDTAEGIGALTTGTPTISFTPILDFHPATKGYVDTEIASASRQEIDTGLWHNDTIDQTDTDIVDTSVYRWRPSGGTTILIVASATYKWTASGSGTSEYYVELLAGGDPSLATPDFVEEDGASMTLNGTLGTLAAGEFGYGDNDALGYSTIYVRLTDSVDPDTKADGYLESRTSTVLGEYYVELLAGGNPGLAFPDDLLINSVSATEGTGGSLSIGEWDYGDFNSDSLGYDTIYARITGNVDPDTQVTGYIVHEFINLVDIATRTLVAGTPSTEVFQYGWIDHGADINDTTLRFRQIWMKVIFEKKTGEGGQNEYVITIPTGDPGRLDENALILDDPPTNVKGIIDVDGFTSLEQISAGMDLYISAVTTTQITMHLDVDGGADGVANHDLVMHISYSGVKTVAL